MRARSALLTLLAAAFIPAGFAQGDPQEQMERVRKRVVTQGAVCPDPGQPCKLGSGAFKPNELSFHAPRGFEFDRGEDRSQPFYAVILRSSGALCVYDETPRLQVQALFPGRKVFAHRHLCDGFQDKVTYTNVDRTRGFLAVYAGATEAEAKAFLARVRARRDFRDAYLRRMQVVVTWQVE